MSATVRALRARSDRCYRLVSHPRHGFRAKRTMEALDALVVLAAEDRKLARLIRAALIVDRWLEASELQSRPTDAEVLAAVESSPTLKAAAASLSMRGDSLSRRLAKIKNKMAVLETAIK